MQVESMCLAVDMHGLNFRLKSIKKFKKGILKSAALRLAIGVKCTMNYKTKQNLLSHNLK